MTERSFSTGSDIRVLDAFESLAGDAAGKRVPSQRALEAAAACLSAGVPVVIPTETVYGLAAPALDPGAVRAVFEIKGRPADNPLIVHVTRDAHLRAVGATLSPLAEHLARRFWPGPLTLVVACQAELPWVTAGLDSVAVRHPAHAFAAALIDRVGPLAAPSANLSGRPSPTRARHAALDLNGRVPLVIDGGDLEHGLESTVIDARGELPVLLRPGALSLESIEAACGHTIASASAHGSVRSPGMKYRHYSPRAEIWLYPATPGSSGAPRHLASDARGLRARGRRVAVIARQPLDVERFITRPEEPRELARHLFGWLRELDELSMDNILIEGVLASGIGRAVMDRLTRAATRVRSEGAAAERERSQRP